VRNKKNHRRGQASFGPGCTTRHGSLLIQKGGNEDEKIEGDRDTPVADKQRRIGTRLGIDSETFGVVFGSTGERRGIGFGEVSPGSAQNAAFQPTRTRQRRSRCLGKAEQKSQSRRRRAQVGQLVADDPAQGCGRLQIREASGHNTWAATARRILHVSRSARVIGADREKSAVVPEMAADSARPGSRLANDSNHRDVDD